MSIDLLNETLSALEGDQPLPGEIRQWLTEGLKAFKQGSKLDKALGLDLKLSRGGRFLNPCLLESYDARNQKLQKLAGYLPGSNWRKARTIVSMIETDPGNPLVSDLIESVPPVPKSAAQVSRILAGETTPDRYL